VNVFVVRVWTGDEPAPIEAPQRSGLGDRPLRGVVQHVRTGGEATFFTSGELFEFLAAPAADCTPATGAAGTTGTINDRG
jgi:hypothetical protein